MSLKADSALPHPPFKGFLVCRKCYTGDMKKQLHALTSFFFEFSPRTQWAIIVFLLISITIAHNSMQIPEMSFLMVVTQKLFFIPVILAGFISGALGGSLVALVAAVLYPHYRVPHLHMEYMFNIPVVSDMVLLLVIGFTTGWLSDRIKEELDRHRRTAQQRDQALQELTYSYERARRAEQLAALGQMAAGIAHEVRNPLTSMQGAVDVLRRSITSNPERAGMLLGRLESEIGRLDDITKHVLLFARPPKTAMTAISPSQLTLEVIETVKSQAKDQGLSIQLNQLHSQEVRIRGDLDQLKQVILNLVLNAFEFADPLSTITLTSQADDKNWSLTVANRGPAIASEDQEHIFEPFFTTRAEGTGLGLAIGARIVEAHDGTIHCQCENGVTRFTITIPRA